jgi:hypothetical protein
MFSGQAKVFPSHRAGAAGTVMSTHQEAPSLTVSFPQIYQFQKSNSLYILEAE